MAEFRKVTDSFSVAPQIASEDLARAAAMGFRTVINNRPDFEEPGQPEGEALAQAARAAGLTYVAVPVRGRPTAEQAEAVRAAVAEADGPVLAWCKSGTRSIMTWAMGQAASGERSREELLSLGAGAGYDLSPVV
ncbi:MAG TPA: TIGR01244 family sulfur transferase [Caulobacteraceae bacterium]|nr:TIGR01244 family sulfur transferase [Caulobacteraceae bacterium]